MFNLNYIEHQMRVIQGYFQETLSAYEIADKKTPNRHWFLLKKIQTFPRRNLITFVSGLIEHVVYEHFELTKHKRFEMTKHECYEMTEHEHVQMTKISIIN